MCVAAVVAARGSVLHAGVRLAENPPSLVMCRFSGDAAGPCWTQPVGFNWKSLWQVEEVDGSCCVTWG